MSGHNICLHFLKSRTKVYFCAEFDLLEEKLVFGLAFLWRFYFILFSTLTSELHRWPKIYWNPPLLCLILLLPISYFSAIVFFSFNIRYQHCFICRRFLCVGGCWDRTQDSCDYGIGRRSKHSAIYLISTTILFITGVNYVLLCVSLAQRSSIYCMSSGLVQNQLIKASLQPLTAAAKSYIRVKLTFI